MYSEVYQLVAKYIYPGKVHRESLRECKRTEWVSRQELEEIQLHKIQQLVTYAYENVPFYRQCYQSQGIHPQDIKSFKDFQALPFLTREDVKNRRQELTSTEYRGTVFEGHTSGSTGTPMFFTMDRNSEWITHAYNERCRNWYGVKLGDKRAFVTVTLQDYPNWHWKKRLVANINRHRYLNVMTMTEEKMKDFGEMLVAWQPAMIRTYPSALALFAFYLKRHGITNIVPKLIESTAEKVTLPQRQLFEEVFHAPVADHYASLEIYSYAYQCPAGGLHVNEDRYLELVAKGQVVNPGQTGEVVVTSLSQYAMPFIRYKNGDVAVFQARSCPCGRSMPVLQEVVGRTCDLLVHPQGHVVHWSSIVIVMMHWKEVQQYQVVQRDRNNLEVRLVCQDKLDQGLLERIRQELQPLFGESMRITFKIIDHVELSSSGKLRNVISEVKPDFM